MQEAQPNAQEEDFNRQVRKERQGNF